MLVQGFLGSLYFLASQAQGTHDLSWSSFSFTGHRILSGDHHTGCMNFSVALIVCIQKLYKILLGAEYFQSGNTLKNSRAMPIYMRAWFKCERCPPFIKWKYPLKAFVLSGRSTKTYGANRGLTIQGATKTGQEAFLPAISPAHS